MNNNVVERYVEQRNNLQNQLNTIIFNQNVSQYGHYNKETEEIRQQINRINEYLEVYQTLISNIVDMENVNNVSKEDYERFMEEVNYRKRNLPSDLVSIIDRRLNYATINITELEEIKDINWYQRRFNTLQQKARELYSAPKLGLDVNRPSEEISKELFELSEILNAYRNVRANMTRLRQLHETDPNNIEEITRLSNLVKQEKVKLPKELLSEIEAHFGNLNKEQLGSVKTDDLDSNKALNPGTKHEITEPIEVKESRIWNNRNKKVLVGIGIATVTAAAFLAYQTIAAMTDNSMVQNIITTMQSNSDLWHHVNETMQTSLHQSNIELAQNISTLTGKTPEFNSTTGHWSINGSGLAEYAQAYASRITAKAVAAGASLVAGITFIASGKPNKQEQKEQLIAYKDNFHEFKQIIKSKGNVKDRLKNFVSNVSLNSKLNKEQKSGLLNKTKETLSSVANKAVEKKDAFVSITQDKGISISDRISEFFSSKEDDIDVYESIEEEIAMLNPTMATSAVFKDTVADLRDDIASIDDSIKRQKLTQLLDKKLKDLEPKKKDNTSVSDASKEMQKICRDICAKIRTEGSRSCQNNIDNFMNEMEKDDRLQTTEKSKLSLEIKKAVHYGEYIEVINAVKAMNNEKTFVFDEKLYRTLLDYSDKIEKDTDLEEIEKDNLKKLIAATLKQTNQLRGMPIVVDAGKKHSKYSKEIQDIVKSIELFGSSLYQPIIKATMLKIQQDSELSEREKESLCSRLELHLKDENTQEVGGRNR